MVRRVVQVGKAKVDNLDVPGLGDEDILDLEIAMYDVVLVAILEHAPDLTHKLPRDIFPWATVADDIVQHLTTIDVFENHVVVVLMDDHLELPHATDVGVVEKHR